MEAIRPVHSRDASTDREERIDEALEELPPPPAPFPVELLSTLDRTARPDISSLQSSCISALTSLLPPEIPLNPNAPLDAEAQQLAAALPELLEVSYELESFNPPEYSQTNGNTTHPPVQAVVNGHSFASLETHLLQVQSAGTSRVTVDLHPAINVVREELAWNRVDTLSRVVLELVRARSHNEVPGAAKEEDEVAEADEPPQYTAHGESGDHELPSYSGNGHGEELKEKEAMADNDLPTRHSTSSAPSEKMMHELEEVTSAIERLHSLNPRLQDQTARMPIASSSRASSSTLGHLQTNGTGTKSKQAMEKQKMKELEEIWDRIERAHGKRKARDDEQRADVNGVEESRARQRFLQSLYDQAEASRMQGQDGAMREVDKELAKARDLRDRDHFLRELFEQSGDGRLADQDSNEPLDRRRAYLLDLLARAESSRLAGQDCSISPERAVYDPREVVTMRDFFATTKPPTANGPSLHNSPLKPEAEDKDEEQKQGTLKKIKGMMKRRSISALGVLNGASISKDENCMSNNSYICEHQERISSIDVRISMADNPSPKDSFSLEYVAGDAQEVLLKSKSSAVARIKLPAPVQPFDPITPETRGSQLRAKLRSLPSHAPGSIATPFHISPLPASELRTLQPESLHCRSCDREVASFGNKGDIPECGVTWKDLPSEHWAEMMEVWMCHSDPSFTARLTKHTENGFWPSPGTVLVGGSYLLLHRDDIENGLVAEGNPLEDWQVLKCEGSIRSTKWAISLRSAGQSEPISYPLSTFIVSDMLELLQAHASHHFVISDEETSERRLVMWLWNPAISISWKGSSQPASPAGSSTKPNRSSSSTADKTFADGYVGVTHLLATEGSCRAAKIFYHVLSSPEESVTHLSGFSGKSQVETLSYPSSTCDRLIATLQDSTLLYPEEERMTAGFEVGILQRAK